MATRPSNCSETRCAGTSELRRDNHYAAIQCEPENRSTTTSNPLRRYAARYPCMRFVRRRRRCSGRACESLQTVRRMDRVHGCLSAFGDHRWSLRGTSSDSCVSLAEPYHWILEEWLAAAETRQAPGSLLDVSSCAIPANCLMFAYLTAAMRRSDRDSARAKLSIAQPASIGRASGPSHPGQ